MKYVVSQRALETIEKECRRYPDAETGGILVGFRDEDRVAITHATGSGPRADRSAHHFTKDTPYLQSVLKLLNHYHQVDYLGVWHKHPQEMPHPSGGDIVSAMEEVSDPDMRLEELITPICVLDQGMVDILPFVIKDDRFHPVRWESVPHGQLVSQRSADQQWHTTEEGQHRLRQEMAEFEAQGVEVDLRQGSDGTYRFHVPLGADSQQRMVLLCPDDYPVTPPEVAVYDDETKEYEPVTSQILNDWNIYQLLADLVREYRGG